MHADPLQADRVEHPRRRLDDALRWMPFTRLDEEAFETTAPSDRRSTASAYSTP
jgi:hypothetical protein